MLRQGCPIILDILPNSKHKYRHEVRGGVKLAPEAEARPGGPLWTAACGIKLKVKFVGKRRPPRIRSLDRSRSKHIFFLVLALPLAALIVLPAFSSLSLSLSSFSSSSSS